jgi:hypothetical protein
MQLQNLTVKTLWLFTPTAQGGLGMTFDPSLLQQMTPNQFAGIINKQLQQNYSQYQFFSNNLSFGGLKQAIDSITMSAPSARVNLVIAKPTKAREERSRTC